MPHGIAGRQTPCGSVVSHNFRMVDCLPIGGVCLPMGEPPVNRHTSFAGGNISF